MKKQGRCELCGRAVGGVEKHHLIPVTRHKNKRNKRLFDRAEVRARVAWLCKPCHKTVHATLSEKELERDFNTLARIAAHPAIQEFINWIRQRPDIVSLPVRRARRESKEVRHKLIRAARKEQRRVDCAGAGKKQMGRGEADD